MNPAKSQLKAKTEPTHLLHQAIGRLVTQGRFPGCDIWKDRACDPDQGHRIKLFQGTGPGRVRLCDVDLLISMHGKATVVIEIEESNMKPVYIFGKFFASAFSTHHGESQIDEKPLLFIQILDTSTLKLDKTGKKDQWRALQTLIRKRAADWPGREMFYEPFEGSFDKFRQGSNEAKRLVDMIQAFLASAG